MRAAWGALAVFLLAAPICGAQALFTATGPGSYLSAGVTVSGFQQDYGRHYVGGESIFIDTHLYRRVGAEFEARQLNFHTEEDVKQTTYMVGPKLSLRARNVRPYGKFLVGRGELQFPFHYAQGSYFAMAPGGGLDYRIPESRVSLRLVDFEYQIWPGFTFGSLHPYGVSIGASYRIF